MLINQCTPWYYGYTPKCTCITTYPGHVDLYVLLHTLSGSFPSTSTPSSAVTGASRSDLKSYSIVYNHNRKRISLQISEQLFSDFNKLIKFSQYY